MDDQLTPTEARIVSLLRSSDVAVTGDELARSVYGGHLPEDDRRNVQVNISRIRRKLGSGAIRHTRQGYVWHGGDGR
jgi:DNA-binding response OmpR family regulator